MRKNAASNVAVPHHVLPRRAALSRPGLPGRLSPVAPSCLVPARRVGVVLSTWRLRCRACCSPRPTAAAHRVAKFAPCLLIAAASLCLSVCPRLAWARRPVLLSPNAHPCAEAPPLTISALTSNQQQHPRKLSGAFRIAAAHRRRGGSRWLVLLDDPLKPSWSYAKRPRLRLQSPEAPAILDNRKLACWTRRLAQRRR